MRYKKEQKEAVRNKLIELYPDNLDRLSTSQVMEAVSQLGWDTMPWSVISKTDVRNIYTLKNIPNVIPITQPVEKSSPKIANEVSLIPQVDSNYVAFGNHKDIESIIKSGEFYPTYITGPTGNGKSTMVEQVCAKNKRDLIRINLNTMSDEEQLIGSKTLEDGNVTVVEGPVLIAMRTGSVLLLDEIDAGAANTLLCLQPILEGKPYYFKLKNEVITPASGFNIIATANTKGKGSDDGRYIGTNVLNEAFLERFAVTFEQEYPTRANELKIINNLMETHGCVDKEFAELLVKWAESIRRTFDDGGLDETITTRRLVHVIKAFSIFKDQAKAIELCCNRFDEQTKESFIDLFSKLQSGEEEVMASDNLDETLNEMNEELNV
jgi:MoxR-like ATPase